MLYSLRPIFPKATALTNNTLAIQVATPTDSSVKAPSTRSCPLPALAVALATFENDWMLAGWGEGIKSGLIDRSSPVPVRATVVARMKHGPVRSRRYQMAGLARARVRLS